MCTQIQSIPTVQDSLLTPCSRWHVLGTRTSHPTVLSLSEGCNIKQKLDVSYGLKCILKTSYSFFFFPTHQLYCLCFVCPTPLQSNLLFSCCFCTCVITYRSNRKGEKEINFLLSQSRLQSATPRQMWGDRRIAHVSVGCGGLAQQGVKSSLGDRELHGNKDFILIPWMWAELSRLGKLQENFIVLQVYLIE